MKMVITGPPKSGKSTLAALLSKITGTHVLHTDDMAFMEWSEASAAVSAWFDQGPDWIIEGVTVPRALRKWQGRNPDAPPPFDWYIYIKDPREFLFEQGQKTMAKQVKGLAD